VLGTRPSRELTVTKKPPAGHATSRLGGLPSGITEKTWPKYRKTPMGFLFQLATGDLFDGFAGVAVFCVSDGTATEDEDNNHAVLLTSKQLATAPLAKPPTGVPVIKPRTITIADPLPELDEEVVGELGSKDADLASAFERYQTKANVQDANLASKLGGTPVWLQDTAGGARGFVAQLDFDHLSIEGGWGLAGCIYVYASGKGATAVWQYT
jgi:hypothetical protein